MHRVFQGEGGEQGMLLFSLEQEGSGCCATSFAARERFFGLSRCTRFVSRPELVGSLYVPLQDALKTSARSNGSCSLSSAADESLLLKRVSKKLRR